jgi:membrane protein
MEKLTYKKYWNILKDTFAAFAEDKIAKLSAALSYYTIFSLPPMLLVTINVFSIFFGQEAIRGEVYTLMQGYVGADTAQQIQDILKETTLKYDSFWATIIGVGALLIGATGIFIEIQDSINFIWGLKTKPKKGMIKLVIDRLLSFSMILVLGFVLMVSLLLSSVVDLLLNRLKLIFSGSWIDALFYFDYVVVFLTFSILIAFIFKVLPSAKIAWKYVFKGAMLTSILFMIGKYLISFYLTKSTAISAYGGSASLIVLLAWVYYSSIILYFGVEFTQVYARYKGIRIEPDNYAVRIEKSVQEKTDGE